MLLICIISIAALVPPGRAPAQSQQRSAISMAQDWDRSLDTVERSMRGGTLTQDQIERFRRILAAIVEAANDAETTAKAQIEAQTRLVDVLGPPPAAGQPAEAGEVGRERKELSDTLAFQRARLAQAELTILRAQELEQTFASLGRERFVETLLSRCPSPLLPDTMAAGLGEALSVASAWLAAPIDWYQGLSGDDQRRIFGRSKALILVVLVAAAIVARRILLRMLTRHAADETPIYGRRLIVALLSASADAVIPLAPIAGIYANLALTSVTIPDLARSVLINTCFLLATIAVAIATTRAVSVREGTALSVTPLDPAAARCLARRALLVALVAAVNQFVVANAGALVVSPACKAVVTLLFAIVAAFSILLLTRRDGWRAAADDAAARQPLLPEIDADTEDDAAGGRKPHPFQALARTAVVLAAAAGVVAAATGYSRFAHYLLANLQITLLAGLVLIALRVLVHEALQRLILAARAPRRAAAGTRASAGTHVESEDGFWLRLLVDPLLLGFGAFLLAPVWQVPREEFVLWLQSLADGVTILGITISPMDLLLALMAFALALTATRALSKALAERILPRTRLDPGIRNSIAVGVGHLGTVLAGLLAIGMLGINLANLALVAGALSVGIGFGLQNIVSNFVSGLILLVERPVKVGDYVVVGDKEGFVRRINVRSTELETLERSTVIVPNSDLLSQAVTNWTHKDTIGRVDVSIGVAYGTDVQMVQELLLQCARNHPGVTSRPPPSVLFRDFGDSACIFELRSFLFDVSRHLYVGSDLRIAIERAFREAGIEIPYPQRVVWMTHVNAAGTPIAPAPAVDPAMAASRSVTDGLSDG